MISSVVIILAGLAGMAAADISQACRTELSSRAVTIIVPNRPGGGYDVYARAVAPALADHTGLRVRVVNNDSGGGSVARQLVLESGAEDLLLLTENVVDLSMDPLDIAAGTYMISAFDLLAVAHIAPDAWVLPQGVDLADTSLTQLVASQGGFTDSVVSVVLVGKALGIETEVVGGYSGSGEFVAAVLRGEVDMTSVSLQTAMSRTEGNDAYVALTVSDGPARDAPDAPYLAGRGGLAEQRSAGLGADTRAQRQELARAAVSLSGAVRGFFASMNIPQSTRDCLREGMAAAFADQSVAKDLARQGRPLAPVTGSDATALVESMVRDADAQRDLLDALLAEGSP